MERIVLIGAGSAMFTRGLVADMIGRRQQWELALVDTDPAALDVAERLAARMIAAGKGPIRLLADTDRRAVLKDAAAVICTIGVGGRRAWEQDVFIPRKHGIHQPVGDSVMPGGTSRALRMIPAMVAIAKDVLDLAPRALFVNYSNPMGPICQGVRQATGAPIVGLCHGVPGSARTVAEALGADACRFRYAAAGLNHCTWLTEARVDGRDVMPELARLAAAKAGQASLTRDAGGRFQEDGSAPAGLPADANPFCWRLMHLFGAFPLPGDRHVTEFFPFLFPQGRYYGKTLGVEAFSFERCIAYGDRIFDEMRETAFSDKPLGPDALQSIPGDHEQVFDLMDSIRTEAGRIFSANLPNRGQIPNLPDGFVVESPAIAEGSGLRPVLQPPLPAGVAGTLATRMLWQQTVVEAALEGSRAKFVQALVLDGAVPSIDTAEALADDLLAAQSAYLPSFRKAT